MKHIKTTSEAEDCARGLYKQSVAGSTVVAGREQEERVARILDLSRQKDLLSVRISEEIGELMKYMTDKETLVNGAGLALATWKTGNPKGTLDWKAMVLELNIPPATVKKFTKISPGARTFSVVG